VIFQGRELHIGDKLVSKRHGEILVSSMHRKFFTATTPGSGQTYDWDYEGCYCYVGDNIIDASWPDASPEQAASPIQALHDRMIDFMDSCKLPPPDVQREAEYRRIWIERAAKCYDYEVRGDRDASFSELAETAFVAADAFLAELKKRDGAKNGAD
jgi:hypothetical protein